MATLSKHGKNIIIENVSYKIAYCEDGKILKNIGSGWKIYKKLKDGYNYIDSANKFKENMKKFEDNKPCYKKWKSVIMQYTFNARIIIISALYILLDDPDGLYSELKDNPFSHKSLRNIMFEDITEIINAYKLALDEQKND